MGYVATEIQLSLCFIVPVQLAQTISFAVTIHVIIISEYLWWWSLHFISRPRPRVRRRPPVVRIIGRWVPWMLMPSISGLSNAFIMTLAQTLIKATLAVFWIAILVPLLLNHQMQLLLLLCLLFDVTLLFVGELIRHQIGVAFGVSTVR